MLQMYWSVLFICIVNLYIPSESNLSKVFTLIMWTNLPNRFKLYVLIMCLRKWIQAWWCFGSFIWYLSICQTKPGHQSMSHVYKLEINLFSSNVKTILKSWMHKCKRKCEYVFHYTILHIFSYFLAHDKIVLNNWLKFEHSYYQIMYHKMYCLLPWFPCL